MTEQNYDTQFSNDDTFSKPAIDGQVTEGSLLDSVKEALAANVENEDLHLRVPARPILRVIYSTFIDGDLFQMWQRKCQIKGTQQMDMIRFTSTVIANQMKGLEVWDAKNKTWREARTPDGEALTFQTADFKGLVLGSKDAYSSAAQMARKLYGIDGHLIKAATEIVEAAGYGDEMNDDFENPTLG